MPRILIVEDDPHILRILAVWLQRCGHEVGEAANGLVAAERIDAESFDLVVSDVNMPSMDGIALIRWLRHKRVSDVPVILLTSRCDHDVLDEELAQLNVAFHPKPFSPSQLVTQIEELMAAGHGLPSTAATKDGITPATTAQMCDASDLRKRKGEPDNA